MTGLEILPDQIVIRVPQRDRKDIDAMTRLIALHSHQIAKKARSRFKDPEFWRRGQPTRKYDEVEIHCVPFPGSAGRTVRNVCRGRDSFGCGSVAP